MKYILYVFLLLLLPSLGMAQDYGSGSPQVMVSPAAAGDVAYNLYSNYSNAANEFIYYDCDGDGTNGTCTPIDDSEDYTVEFYAKCDDSATTYRLLGATQDEDTVDSGAYNGFQQTSNSDNKMAYYWAGYQVYAYVDNPSDDNTWHRWTWTHDATAGTFDFYIDGSSIDTDLPDSGSQREDVWITGSLRTGDQSSLCDITDIRVWEIERSATNIAATDDCYITSADADTEGGPWLNWRPNSDEDGGTTVTDSWTNGYDGTTQTGAWGENVELSPCSYSP